MSFIRVKKVIKFLLPLKILNIWWDHKFRKSWANRKSNDSDKHLELYWNSRNTPNREKLIQILIDQVNSLDRMNVISILEYGSHVGINLDILNGLIKYEKRFFAVELNYEAIEFMRARLPFIECLHSDNVGFVNNHTFPGNIIDISFVNSVFYCMPAKSVFSVLSKLAMISNIIVLGEGMENADGDKGSYFLLDPPCYQHPYNKWLSQLGFTMILSVNAPDPRQELNQFRVYIKKFIESP